MAITAIVVTYNEERRLEACLKSLKFCSQLIVVDIGSTDRCVEIARACGAEVISHPWVPIGELVLPDTIGLSICDWILRLDPDEIVPEALAQSILDAIINIGEDVGQISLPHQYYFLGKPLTTSIWGGIRFIPRIIHRDRVIYNDMVHHGPECKDGYVLHKIEYTGMNALEHYWIDSYQQLWEKHWRYIKLEGKSRYNNGKRFSLFHLLRETEGAFYKSIIVKRGWRGGFTGIYLSLFYTGYIFMSILSLALFQIKHSKPAFQ
ncbi:MAG: glycosyltransferase family 2 protein [Anaerolineales bacterium]